jgi:hypothetical protein
MIVNTAQPDPANTKATTNKRTITNPLISQDHQDIAFFKQFEKHLELNDIILHLMCLRVHRNHYINLNDCIVGNELKY